MIQKFYQAKVVCAFSLALPAAGSDIYLYYAFCLITVLTLAIQINSNTSKCFQS